MKKVWKTPLVKVTEKEFDGNLHIFEVVDLSGKHLGFIYPAEIKFQENLISDLDNGACPIADK